MQIGSGILKMWTVKPSGPIFLPTLLHVYCSTLVTRSTYKLMINNHANYAQGQRHSFMWAAMLRFRDIVTCESYHAIINHPELLLQRTLQLFEIHVKL